MDRRSAILTLLGGAASTARAGTRSVAAPIAAAPSPAGTLCPSDDALIDDISNRAFLYFAEQAHPHTGLVFDRARTGGSRPSGTNQYVASIAATGFGLTALAIGAQRRWIQPKEALLRVRTALRFLAKDAAHERGWFYHFYYADSGGRAWHSEASSIDTALLLAGVLTARQAFKDPEIERLSRSIWERVEFPWMMNGHPTLLSHGWKPESGFLPYRWDSYSELGILYLLGLGSPAHPLPSQSWNAWSWPRVQFGEYAFVSGGPLFTHQFPQAWVDLRGLRDRAPLRYFENSVTATRAHKAYCLQMAAQFPQSYSEDVWGVTASDSEHGYVAWGGPRSNPALDGTVTPCAPGGSLMFAPDICIPALRTMQERFGDTAYGRYGFCDAFNPTTGWVNSDVIGIDVGMTLLSAENLRSGSVWRWFMQNAEVRNALVIAGFHSDRLA